MTKEEYLSKRKFLKSEYQKDLNNLKLKYAKTNAVCKVGDFVTDHISTILVEEIEWGTSLVHDTPVTIYSGPVYTKAGKPRKNGVKRSVWGHNVKDNKKEN